MADGVRSAGDDDQVEARRQIRNPVCDGHPARIAERPDGVRQRPDELGRAGQPDAAGPDETPDRGALGPALALLHDRARLGRPLDREVDDHVAVGQRGFDAVAGAAEDADHPAILRQHLGEESPDAPLTAHLGQVLQEQARDAPTLDIVTDEERDVRRAVVGGWRARHPRPNDVADDRDDLVADRHDQSDPPGRTRSTGEPRPRSGGRGCRRSAETATRQRPAHRSCAARRRRRCARAARERHRRRRGPRPLPSEPGSADHQRPCAEHTGGPAGWPSSGRHPRRDTAERHPGAALLEVRMGAPRDSTTSWDAEAGSEQAGRGAARSGGRRRPQSRVRAGSPRVNVRTGPGPVSAVSKRTVTRPRPLPHTQPRPCSACSTSAPGCQRGS